MLPAEIVAYIESVLSSRGMAKGEFYAKSGISAAVFSTWRAGRNFPSMDALARINDVLGTSFGITLLNEAPATPKDDGLTDAQRELIQLIRSMSPGEVSVLSATAKAQAALRKSPDGQG